MTGRARAARELRVSGDEAAATELAQVQAEIEAARAQLSGLLQEVAAAEAVLREGRAAELLAANEQLVLAALRIHSEAELARQRLAEAARAAELDPLTQLPNRLLLLDRLAQAIATARRHERRLAVLFLDLDHFKQINDTLGHAVGDEMLKVVAQRLQAAVRDADTVCRHGGDEFVVLLTEIAQPADAGRIADALVLALAAPSRIGDRVMRLGASVGIAIHPDDGDDAQTLLSRADAAMYRVKRQGLGGVAFHDPQPALPALALRDLLPRHGAVPTDPAQRVAALCEANEQLVLAVLGAQGLQAAAERAQRQQSEFMTAAARELAHPLAPIRQAAVLLGQVHTADPLLRRAQTMVAQQVDSLAWLVAAVERVSTAGRAALHLERQPVDLAGVVDAAVLQCRPSMDARRQTFSARMPAGEAPVMGEPARLQQVVRNLLDNASQYTPPGGRIELALEVFDDAVEFSIADTGIGLSATALPTIFEAFARDLPALGPRSGSAGVGLSVVRTLVQAHGGTVVARSAGAGQGSRFTVRLPRAAAAA